MVQAVIGTEIVFIVGGSRSGTTLLSKILGRHSKMFGLQETHFFGDLWNLEESTTPWSVEYAVSVLAKLFARQRSDIWCDTAGQSDFIRARDLIKLSPDTRPSSIFIHFTKTVAKLNGKVIPVEQTPRNIFYVQDILDLYPGAKVIEMVRDPRAVLYSQRARWCMRFLGAKNVPWKEVIRVFVNYHAITMSYLWKSAVITGNRVTADPRVLRCKYEDLVAEPIEMVRKLCSFLMLEYESDMQSVPRIASSTLRNTDKTSGINADSAEIWKKRLPAGDLILCEYILSREAKEVGYQIETQKSKLYTFSVFLHLLRYPFHLLMVPIINPSRTWTMFKIMLHVKWN